MTDATNNPGGVSVAQVPGRDRLLLVWSALGVILPSLMPNIGPVVLALSIAAPLLLTDRRTVMRRLASPTPVVGLLLVIVCYMCLNVLLAPTTDNAAGAIATVIAATLAIHVAGAAYPGLSTHHLRLMARGLAIGCLVAVSFLFFEYVSRMSVQRGLQHVSGVLNIRLLRFDTGTWSQPNNFGMSRNLAMLVMLSWASMAFGLAVFAGLRRTMVPVAILLLAGLSALLSPSATVRMGFFAGCGAWIICTYAPRIAAFSLYAGWTIVCLGCIPLAHVIHRFRLYDLEWIVASGRHRMMIWTASAEWFWRNPILGLGIGGARQTNLNDGLQISAAGVGTQKLDWHAHNAFIQTWLETGVVGALLLFVLGLVVIRAAFRLPPPLRPFAVATFVSIFFIGLTGFSLWAAWYLAAFGLAGLCVVLASFVVRAEAPLQPRAGG